MAVHVDIPSRVAPPGPRSIVPGQQMVRMMRNPIDLLMDAAQYGDVVRLQIGPNIYLANHPDIIRDILVTNQRMFVKSSLLRRMRALLGNGLLTSEGQLHLRQRRLIQPAFHRQRIAGYAKIITDTAQRSSERWKTGEVRNIHAEMMHLTMIIAGQAFFGANVESEAEEIGQAITTLMRGSRRLRLPFYQQMMRLPLPSNRRILEAGERLDALIQTMIAERRAAIQRGEIGKYNDLMDMLLQARDDLGDGQGMSDALVRDEVLTLFLAGHETTANALTWTWYLLSKHPDVEAKLHEELAQVLNGRVPAADDVEKLSYTRKVLSESMRLYPPSWTIGREALDDYQAGDFRLPSGSTILMSQWVMHHDPRYYPDPYRFDPERWTPEAVAARPKYSYFPFGGGPRVCVGEPFAWMEGTLVLAALAQRWRLRLVPGQKIDLLPQVTLRPRYGMRMEIQSISE